MQDRIRSSLPVAVAIALMSAASMAPEAHANLLANPGFETGTLSGWSPSGADVYASDSQYTSVHDGQYGAALDSAGDASLTQSVVLPVQGLYDFGGWMRAFLLPRDDVSGIFDQIQFSVFVAATGTSAVVGGSTSSFPNFVLLQRPVILASDWTFFQGSFDYSGPIGATALLNFNLQNSYSPVTTLAAGDSFFIRARTTTVPEPGTLALLGLGLGALGLARRRRCPGGSDRHDRIPCRARPLATSP